MVDEYCCMSEKRIKGKMTREVSLRKKKIKVWHMVELFISMYLGKQILFI